eukprot:172285-Pelagomonas_calceolata.AAC.2
MTTNYHANEHDHKAATHKDEHDHKAATPMGKHDHKAAAQMGSLTSCTVIHKLKTCYPDQQLLAPTSAVGKFSCMSVNAQAEHRCIQVIEIRTLQQCHWHNHS